MSEMAALREYLLAQTTEHRDRLQKQRDDLIDERDDLIDERDHLRARVAELEQERDKQRRIIAGLRRAVIVLRYDVLSVMADNTEYEDPEVYSMWVDIRRRAIAIRDAVLNGEYRRG